MTERPHVFLSHSDGDREIAEIVASTIRRATLQQLEVWFSSDRAPQGGIAPGDTWATEVLSRLRRSTAVLLVVTPRSVAKQWLHFECGYVAGRDGALVVPICFGVDPTLVPLPISMYQLYSVADRNSFQALLAKLSGHFGIHHDEVMTRPLLDEALTRLAPIRFEEAAAQAKVPGLRDAVEEMQAMFDRRFLELAAMLGDREAPLTEYTVPITVAFRDLAKTFAALIGPTTTVQDIADRIFFSLERRVEAYTYLDQWVLLGAWEGSTVMRPLMMRGFVNAMPAGVIFRPGSRWRAVELTRPYVANQPLETTEGPVPDR